MGPPELEMSESPDTQKLISWLEHELAGTVERCERQQRWRPGWFVDFRSNDGTVVNLFVRGDRNEDFPPWPLEYERNIIEILQSSPIPVPRIYGFCPDPRAIVLERIRGRPNLKTASDETERLAVMDQLARHVAAMHSLSIEPFVKSGMKRPTTVEERTIPYFLEGEKLYLRHKQAADPRMEFIRRWVHQNVPTDRPEICFLHGDPGQFLFENGKITTMLDFEWSCLGDPMMDLGGLRLRALHEPMGDIAPLFRRYAEVSGRRLKRDVIGFHTVAFIANNGLAISHAVSAPKPGVDYPEYVSWYILGVLFSLKAIAEVRGIRLEKPPEVPPEAPSRWGRTFDVLASTFGTEVLASHPEAIDSTALHQRNLAQSIADFSRKLDVYRTALDGEYVADVAQLLGRPINNWMEADDRLEAFVVAAGPDRDDELLKLFYRWSWRQIAPLRGVIKNEMWDLDLQPLSELI
jgi:aminoglycoside phosphotransferase (APT) family kinase protein